MTATLSSNEFALPAPYPPSIARAADRATDCRIPAISALKPYARLLLQTVVRSIQTKDIANSVRISNECFAQTLHVSVNKICKIKKELESKEWIVRSQVQSRRLGMQVSDIFLTPWALQTLGLVSGRAKDHPVMPIPTEEQIAIRAAVVLEPTPPQRIEIEISSGPSTPATSDAAVATAEPSPQPQPEPDPQAAYYANNQVPDDLMPLRHLGLRASAIRKLMGMASKAGLMLGHIVELAEDSIAKAKNPYAYTVKLLSSNIDWQGRLAAKRQREAQQQEATAQEQQTTNDASTLRQALAQTGLLSSEKRLYVWQWNSSSAVLERTNIENFVCNPLLAKWSVVLDTPSIAQAIRAGTIFAVTKEQLEQWQTAPSDDADADADAPPLVFTPPTPAPASEAIVQPQIEDEGRVHPWHGTPVAANMDALFAAASASPQRWLCNPTKKTVLFSVDNDWIRMAKVQEVQSKEAHKVQWLAVPPSDVTKVAQLLQKGQLIPVDKATVQSWEPSQPQRETPPPEAAPATKATQSSSTRQSGWQGLGNLLGGFAPA